MDLREYYGKIRAAEDALPAGQDVCHIKSKRTSTGAKPGMVIEVPRALAAKYIAEDSHELASEAEVEQYKVDQEAARQAIIDFEFEKKQTVNLKIDSTGRPQIDRSRRPKAEDDK